MPRRVSARGGSARRRVRGPTRRGRRQIRAMVRGRLSNSGSGGPRSGGNNAAPGLSFNFQPGYNVRSLPLFPYRTRRTLTYSESVVVPGTAAGVANGYIFAANGLYDPNISGTGHQPMGFDQMIAYYNHYVVVNARIRVIVQSQVTSGIMTGLLVSGDNTLTTDATNLVENGEISCYWLAGKNAQGAAVEMNRKLNIFRFEGVDDGLDDPTLRGTATSNPTELAFFHIMIWDPTASVVPSAYATVIIEYDTWFLEPRKATSSLGLETKLNSDFEKLCMCVGTKQTDNANPKTTRRSKD